MPDEKPKSPEAWLAKYNDLLRGGHSLTAREWGHYDTLKRTVAASLAAQPPAAPAQPEKVQPFPAALEKTFEDHYWGSFQADREPILQHIRAVLREYQICTAVARAAMPPAAPVETEVGIIVERLLKLAACEDELSHDCDMRPEDTANSISAQWLREAASFIQTAQAAQRSSAAPVEPYAWVIPGDDQSRPSGSIDAMAWREGEFTKPLYAQMPAAGMSRDDAESLVFDLLDAARSFDQAETAFRRGAREYYEEMRDKVISALSIPHRSSGEPAPVQTARER